MSETFIGVNPSGTSGFSSAPNPTIVLCGQRECLKPVRPASTHGETVGKCQECCAWKARARAWRTGVRLTVALSIYKVIDRTPWRARAACRAGRLRVAPARWRLLRATPQNEF